MYCVKQINHCSKKHFQKHLIVHRLKHYFLTYKNMPGLEEHICEITEAYGQAEAFEVIKRAWNDYNIEIKPNI